MKLFVWDFHGVLEQNNELAVLEITNRVLIEGRFKERMSQQQCHDFYGLKWFEYFQNLNQTLSHEECLSLQEKCIIIANTEPNIIAKYIVQTTGADLVLNKISTTHQQILISNTDPDSIKLFINATNISQYFNEKNTFPVNSHRDHKKTKKEILTNYLAASMFIFEEVITIGDSPGDIELATVHPKSKSYLYSHPGRPHKDCQADYKINDLLEILREV